MPEERQEYYFKKRQEWRRWLMKNHTLEGGIYLIFYKLSSGKETMRWEEAVQEALCFGWIDSTVKKLDEERRRQLFTQRKRGSTWSKVNKNYIEKLIAKGLMHEAGLSKVNTAKIDGSWTILDDVENLIIPKDLQDVFNENSKAFDHYQAFSKTYKKNYLYWLNQAKRTETRQKKIAEIIRLCAENIKSRH